MTYRQHPLSWFLMLGLLRWVEAGPVVLNRLKMDGAINSGGCIASISCGIAHSALQLGLLEVNIRNAETISLMMMHSVLPQHPKPSETCQNHLDHVVKPALSRQSKALTLALRDILPDCAFLQPRGGYFVWIKLTDKVRQ